MCFAQFSMSPDFAFLFFIFSLVTWQCLAFSENSTSAAPVLHFAPHRDPITLSRRSCGPLLLRLYSICPHAQHFCVFTLIRIGSILASTHHLTTPWPVKPAKSPGAPFWNSPLNMLHFPPFINVRISIRYFVDYYERRDDPGIQGSGSEAPYTDINPCQTLEIPP